MDSLSRKSANAISNDAKDDEIPFVNEQTLLARWNLYAESFRVIIAGCLQIPPNAIGDIRFSVDESKLRPSGLVVATPAALPPKRG